MEELVIALKRLESLDVQDADDGGFVFCWC